MSCFLTPQRLILGLSITVRAGQEFERCQVVRPINTEVAQKYFVAQPVEVNPFKLMFGSVFSAEVATTDHPSKPVTATFERISGYLLKYDQGAEVLTVKP